VVEDADWSEIDRLFDAALDLEPAARGAFLDASCSRPGVRAKVEALLAETEIDGELLQPGGALESGFAESLSSELQEERHPPSPRVGDRIGRWRVTAPVLGEVSAELYEACDDHGREAVLEPLPPGLSEAVEGWRRIRDHSVRMPTASELGGGEIVAIESWQGREVCVWRRGSASSGSDRLPSAADALSPTAWIWRLGWIVAAVLLVVLLARF